MYKCDTLCPFDLEFTSEVGKIERQSASGHAPKSQQENKQSRPIRETTKPSCGNGLDDTPRPHDCGKFDLAQYPKGNHMVPAYDI
jgi:hypothetical protein